MKAIYRPVLGGYTLVILDEEEVPLPWQDPDFVHPSKRAARKAAQRIVDRYTALQILDGSDWEVEEI